MEKLSDIFSYAMTYFYKPANPESLSDTGMCRALNNMFRIEVIPFQVLLDARYYINGLFEELQYSMRLEDDELFAYLYEPLESFKGYDVNDLQYLVWQAIIDKLRSVGK